MTREQAIESLSWLKARLSIGLGGMDKLSPHYKDMADEVRSIAVAIAALRGPQPDPDTGLMRCDYCNGTEKPFFHENNYEPHESMQSWIIISESKESKRHLIEVDLWDGANAYAAFEINYCPMCGRKLEVEG